MTPVWIKILITAFAGGFMVAVVVWLGRQMLMFLSEVLGEDDNKRKESKNE